MLIDRLEFEIHIANDATCSFFDGHSKETTTNDGQKQNVRTLVLGADGKPVIPASSMKGALRNAYSNADENLSTDDIFGYANADQQDKNSQISRLQLDDAIWKGRETDWKTSRNRTAINRQRGSAEHNKLFADIVLQPGSEFKLRGRIFYNAEDGQGRADAITDLRDVLSPLLTGNGLMLGSGGKFASGGFRQLGEITCKAIEFDGKTGAWADGPGDISSTFSQIILKLAATYSAPVKCTTFAIELIGTTPFIVVDPDKSKQDDADPGNVKPLLNRDGGPALPVSSLYGALRNRAAWICEVKRLRDPAYEKDKTCPKHPLDDRDLTGKLGGAVRNSDDIGKLTAPERLFGVSGFKGLLQLESFKLKNPGEKLLLANVAIDRFTGGALDTALFKSSTRMGAEWQVEFSIDQKRANTIYNEGDAEARDRELLEMLASDLEQNGLMLGHASSRGLGWFDVEPKLDFVGNDNG